jgi:hypothetical protein
MVTTILIILTLITDGDTGTRAIGAIHTGMAITTVIGMVTMTVIMVADIIPILTRAATVHIMVRAAAAQAPPTVRTWPAVLPVEHGQPTITMIFNPVVILPEQAAWQVMCR